MKKIHLNKMKNKLKCLYNTHMYFMLPNWWHETFIQADPFTKLTKYITTRAYMMPKTEPNYSNAHKKDI